MTSRRTTLLLHLLLVAVIMAETLTFMTHEAQAVANFTIPGGGGDYAMKVGTLQQARFRNIVRQNYDFSCGSAAVATLLTYHYDYSIDEKSVLADMYENGDRQKILREGFSLLDMKNYLHSIGYKAEGYRESLDKLTAVGIPAIVLINKKGYLHFVVVKGVYKDKVSVGDPTLGLRVYSRKDFEDMWNGILFVVLNEKSTGQEHFNLAADWSIHGNPNFLNVLTHNELSVLTADMAFKPGVYW